MTKKQIMIKDPDLAKVGAALKRAAAKARQLGIATNTPVYVYRKGKIVDILAEQQAIHSPKNVRGKSARKKTPTHHRTTQSKSPK